MPRTELQIRTLLATRDARRPHRALLDHHALAVGPILRIVMGTPPPNAGTRTKCLARAKC